MGKTKAQLEDEPRNIILRTTADIMSNALVQLECCVKDWGEYADFTKQMREVTQRMIDRATLVGYIPKTRI